MCHGRCRAYTEGYRTGSVLRLTTEKQPNVWTGRTAVHPALHRSTSRGLWQCFSCLGRGDKVSQSTELFFVLNVSGWTGVYCQRMSQRQRTLGRGNDVQRCTYLPPLGERSHELWKLKRLSKGFDFNILGLHKRTRSSWRQVYWPNVTETLEYCCKYAFILCRPEYILVWYYSIPRKGASSYFLCL